MIRKDPLVRKYAMMSLRGAQAAAVALLAWAATFVLGGEGLFGEEFVAQAERHRAAQAGVSGNRRREREGAPRGGHQDAGRRRR